LLALLVGLDARGLSPGCQLPAAAHNETPLAAGSEVSPIHESQKSKGNSIKVYFAYRSPTNRSICLRLNSFVSSELAQLVERQSHNLKVGSSILPFGVNFFFFLPFFFTFYFLQLYFFFFRFSFFPLFFFVRF
jgi:hypothetical protein